MAAARLCGVAKLGLIPISIKPVAPSNCRRYMEVIRFLSGNIGALMAQSYPRRRARYFSRSLQLHLARQVAVVRIYNFATIAHVMAIDDSLKKLLRFLFTLDWRGGVARG